MCATWMQSLGWGELEWWMANIDDWQVLTELDSCVFKCILLQWLFLADVLRIRVIGSVHQFLYGLSSPCLHWSFLAFYHSQRDQQFHHTMIIYIMMLYKLLGLASFIIYTSTHIPLPKKIIILLTQHFNLKIVKGTVHTVIELLSYCWGAVKLV